MDDIQIQANANRALYSIENWHDQARQAAPWLPGLNQSAITDLFRAATAHTFV
jgi:hypothetical protein